VEKQNITLSILKEILREAKHLAVGAGKIKLGSQSPTTMRIVNRNALSNCLGLFVDSAC
jgi:hypothetical protein